MAVLNELWNADKHRTVALVSAWPRLEVFLATYDEFEGHWGPAIVKNGSQVLRGSQPFAPGEEFYPMVDVQVSLGGKDNKPETETSSAQPIGDLTKGLYRFVGRTLEEFGLLRRPFGAPSGFDRHESFFQAPPRDS